MSDEIMEFNLDINTQFNGKRRIMIQELTASLLEYGTPETIISTYESKGLIILHRDYVYQTESLTLGQLDEIFESIKKCIDTTDGDEWIGKLESISRQLQELKERTDSFWNEKDGETWDGLVSTGIGYLLKMHQIVDAIENLECEIETEVDSLSKKISQLSVGAEMLGHKKLKKPLTNWKKQTLGPVLRDLHELERKLDSYINTQLGNKPSYSRNFKRLLLSYPQETENILNQDLGLAKELEKFKLVKFVYSLTDKMKKRLNSLTPPLDIEINDLPEV